MNFPAEVGPGVGQGGGLGLGLGLGLVGPPLRILEPGVHPGDFIFEYPLLRLVLGAPSRLTRLHLGRMPLEISLEGGRRPYFPH